MNEKNADAESSKILVDVSTLFQKEALRGVRHTLTLDLAIELGRPGSVPLAEFVQVARDSLSGDRKRVQSGRLVWIDFAPQERAFAFKGQWIVAHVGPGTVSFDLVSRGRVLDQHRVEIDKAAKDLEDRGITYLASSNDRGSRWVSVDPT